MKTAASRSLLLLFILLAPAQLYAVAMLTYTVDPSRQKLVFYWRNAQGAVYGNFANLDRQLAQQHRRLVFAMNGGMYTETQSPLGLFIENGKMLQPLNKVENGYGNFYMQPNGVFCLDRNGKAAVVSTKAMKLSGSIKYATQSGPMLVINGVINPVFRRGSQNLNLRNGVGILPDGRILFVLSKEPVSFYDFALYFQQAGCKNALYLDGFVSRAWLPAAGWRQTDGQFGVIMAEIQ